MQESILSSVILPLAIAIIMITLGMTLTVADFKRIVIFPKPVFIGLLCQMILLPVLGFGAAAIFALPAIWMYVTGFALAFWMARRSPKMEAATAS